MILRVLDRLDNMNKGLVELQFLNESHNIHQLRACLADHHTIWTAATGGAVHTEAE